MPTPNPFFLFPFGTSGDDTVVPNTGASTGTMSYQYGFTPNYEADLLTDPAAIPVPRAQMNQLFFDITTALQIIQTQGLPTWVAAGSGGPTNYPKGAMVNYLGVNYISTIATNSNTPGDNATWFPLGYITTVNIPVPSSGSIPASPGTSTPANVGSLAVPPGLWRIDANIICNYSIGSVGGAQYGFAAGLNTVSATFPAGTSLSTGTCIGIAGTTGSVVPPLFLDNTTTGTQTVYLCALGFYTSGTFFAGGNITATLLNAP